jgi:3-oxoacyl-[acyl-carrier protein] reductase
MSSLNGKVAIVTGSSRGIGRAIAERFAVEGALVAVNFARSADEASDVVASIQAKGGKAVAIQADTGIIADIRRLFRETIATFGHIDIVVNNAGPLLTPSRSPAASEAEFDATCRFCTGSLFVMQEAARALPDGGHHQYLHRGDDYSFPLRSALLG